MLPPRPKEADAQAIEQALRADEDLERLEQALLLGERFRFHILVADAPASAQAALRHLERSFREPFRRLDAEPARGVNRSLEGPALTKSILATFQNQVVDGKLVVTVLDASAATPSDGPAWRELFRQMNERRNEIARLLNGALILCVPPRLEIAFAQEAPDFWSVRSSITRLAPWRVPVELPHSPLAAERTLGLGSESTWREPAAVEAEMVRLEKDLEAARQRVEDNPHDRAALEALAIHWLRVGRQAEERSDLERAKVAYERALGIRKELWESDRDSESAIDDLAESLVDLGDVRSAQGSLAAAEAAYAESLELMRRLLARDPDRAEWLRDLSVSLERLGDVRRAQGSLADAEAAYAESLELMRRLLARDPDRAEWLRDLSVSLNKLGDVRSAQGSLADAEAAYAESLELRRRLLARDPDRAEWLRDLSVSLGRLSSVAERRGDLQRALDLNAESLALGRRLLQRDPRRPLWRQDITWSLTQLARILRALGRIPEAEAAEQEAASLETPTP